MAIPSNAQEIEKFKLTDESERFGTKVIPADIKNTIVGYYRNIDNSDGKPFVELKEDNTGFVQMHGTEPYPVEYWIETDEKGEPLIQKGEGNPNYAIVLIAKFGSNGQTGVHGKYSGDTNRIAVFVDLINKKAIIYGERVKVL